MATSLAWFTTLSTLNTNVTGRSITNYYAGGNGTQATPYLLNTPQHIYNLTWLQNSGYYTSKVYFKLDANINMAGSLKGINGTTTGAIPPIGTDAKPFLGDFDGNGKTISNLWVSSDPNDWKEKPLDISSVQVGNSIGFFGNIGNLYVNETTSIIGTAKKFYLENIDVTCKTTSSKVGIVAGYTNGNLQQIGVKNAKILLSTSGIVVKSDYSLIGETGPNISWADSPSDLVAGNLIVDPNRPESPFTNLTSGTRVVEGSAVDTAYYISSLTILAINGGVSYNFYKYNTKVLCTTSTTAQEITAQSSNVTTLSQTNYQGYVTQDFVTRYYAATTNKTDFLGSVAPTFTNTINLTLQSGTTIPVPKNSIWFKPKKGGVSGLTFIRQSQAAGTESMSVYHYKRVGTNITNFGEIRFAIDKISNKAAVYFDFEIPQAMVNEGYEFLVGASTTDAATTSGFLYLSLAGTNESAGPQSAQVFAIDYVYRLTNGLLQDVMIANYVPKKTLLKFSGTFNGTICYNMKDGAAYDGKVYYGLNASNIVVQDLVPVSTTVGVSTTYNTTMFPNRIQS